MHRSYGWRFLLGGFILKAIGFAVKSIFIISFLPFKLAIRAPWAILALVISIIMVFARGGYRLSHWSRKRAQKHYARKLEGLNKPITNTLPDGSVHIKDRNFVHIGKKCYVRNQLKVIPSPFSPKVVESNLKLAGYYKDFPLQRTNGIELPAVVQ